MFKRALWIFGLFALAACSLSGAPEAPPGGVAPALPTLAVLPGAEETPAASRTPAPTTPPPTACAPRADWTGVHVVAPGDTLTALAQRSGSTVRELAAGNCLSNANSIVVGRQLRLPPGLPTADLTPTLTLTLTPTITQPFATFTPPFAGALPPLQAYSRSSPTLRLSLDYPAAWTFSEVPYSVTFAAPDNSEVIEVMYGEPDADPPADLAAECKASAACLGGRPLLAEGALILRGGFPAYQLRLGGDPAQQLGPAVYTFISASSRNFVVRGFGTLIHYDIVLNSLRTG